MSDLRPLYERDLVRWSEEQAQAIRAAAASGTNLPLDWENIAEEIDTVGRSQRNQLRNRIRTLVAHLLKLRYSPATEPREGWANTVRRTRQQIKDLTSDSPSLRPERSILLQEVLVDEPELTAQELAAAGEYVAAAELRASGERLTVDQVFGGWLPTRPEPPAERH